MHFAGDTASFAIKLAFIRDPHGGAAAGDAEAASWGSFELWVEGRNLCAHREYSESSDGAHWYLLPLLEWFAREWDPLLHEERLPIKIRGVDAAHSMRQTRFAPRSRSAGAAASWEEEWYAWWQRHALRAARSGGLFPNVVFRRWRDRVEISWDATPLPGVPREVSFEAAGGTARLEPHLVAEPLHDVLSATSLYLLECVPSSSRVAALRRSVEQLTLPARTTSRYAWLAGLGHDRDAVVASWRRIEERLSDASETVRSTLFGSGATGLVVTRGPAAAQMFGSVSPEVADEDVAVILGLMAELVDPQGEEEALIGLVVDVPVDLELGPGEHGHVLAVQTLSRLGIEQSGWIDIESILTKLGVRTPTVSMTDRTIRGLATAGGGLAPAAAVNESYPWQSHEVRRATLAHELCHLLFDRGVGKPLAVASGPWAPLDVEQRANAFAAMFLMPPAAVAEVVSETDAPHDWQTIGTIAKHFRTSRSLTLEHLHNLGYVREFDYEQMHDIDIRRGTKRRRFRI